MRPMEDILKEINAVAGVTGCFVCSREGRLVASALPDLFDERVVSTVGRTIVRTTAGLAVARGRKGVDLDLVYDHSRLVTKNLKDGCLCVLCVRNVNIPLLNLTADTAAKKLASRLEEAVREKPPAPPEARGRAIQPVGAAFLGTLEGELARAIGPMAAFVVDEVIQDLGESRESLPSHKATILVEGVSREIPDEEKRLRFTESMLQAMREQGIRR
jgi:predicted regulator of Ras-like GTPase activity (Roadblock/LC7/MglB family)